MMSSGSSPSGSVGLTFLSDVNLPESIPVSGVCTPKFGCVSTVQAIERARCHCATSQGNGGIMRKSPDHVPGRGGNATPSAITAREPPGAATTCGGSG